MLLKIDFWYIIIRDVGIYGLLLAIVVVLYYEFKLINIQNQVKKYEYAGANEIVFLKASAVIFTIAIICFIFFALTRILGSVATFEYYFMGFVSIGIGFMLGYSLYQFFKIYYPFILEKRLSRIRFKPRVSPKTGKPMRLLNELEEDAHLSEEMIGHELAFTYDYDVWLDEDTGYKLIERYDGHIHTLICPNCHFRTLKDYKEDIITPPSTDREGLLKKFYKCSYCEHAEIKEVKIASLKQEKELGVYK